MMFQKHDEVIFMFYGNKINLPELLISSSICRHRRRCHVTAAALVTELSFPYTKVAKSLIKNRPLQRSNILRELMCFSRTLDESPFIEIIISIFN
jgi:hypothetical protein